MTAPMRRVAPSLAGLAVAAAAVALLLELVGLVPIRLSMTLLALVAIGLDSARSPDRLAWWWGFLLPVDFIIDVEPLILDAARYGGLAWLCVRVRPTLSSQRRPLLMAFAVTLAVVAVIRGTASVARADRFGIYIAIIMLVGAATAPLVARRVSVHRQVLGGFMGGVVLSSIVSLSQAARIPTLMEGNQEGSRFPGLASTTMLFTWHLAFALIIAIYFLWSRHARPRNRYTAMAVVPLAAAALLVNGAQGGLLGLALAAMAVTAFAWRVWPWETLVRWALGGAAAALVLLVVVLASGVRVPTIDGIRGVGGYENEIARWEVAVNGWKETAANPLVGVGRTNFEDQYELAPHFLPLEAGVTAGMGALLVGSIVIVLMLWVVVRGPVGNTPSAWLGLALTSSMVGYALISSGGPFAGLPRFTLLLIAVLACRGEPWPPEPTGAAAAATDETELDRESSA